MPARDAAQHAITAAGFAAPFGAAPENLRTHHETVIQTPGPSRVPTRLTRHQGRRGSAKNCSKYSRRSPGANNNTEARPKSTAAIFTIPENAKQGA
jgi:hypothetical protein